MMNEATSPLVDIALHAVRGHLAFEMCVEQLGSAIQLGIFRVGDRLPPERELAARLDVSRATLREAISALRAAGLVTTIRGRDGGTIVAERKATATIDLAEIADIATEIRDVMVFRSAIEVGAADTAARTDLSAAQRELLTESLREVETAENPEQYRQADARLHLAISTVTGSESLASACNAIQIRLHQLLMRIPVLGRNIEHSDEQHRIVVQSILAGDALTARQTMQDHCDATAALLKGLAQ